MVTLVRVIFTIVCLFLIIVVLLQPGKSGGLGAAFGGGGNTVFGASGATPTLRKITVIMATLFMLLSLLLAWFSVGETVKTDNAPVTRGLDFTKVVDENADQQVYIPERNIAPLPDTAAQTAPAVPAQEPIAAPVVPAAAPEPVAADPAPTENPGEDFSIHEVLGTQPKNPLDKAPDSFGGNSLMGNPGIPAFPANPVDSAPVAP